MGTHMKVLSESFPMNTNMTGFRCFFQKYLHPCALAESSLSIGKVKGEEGVPLLNILRSPGQSGDFLGIPSFNCKVSSCGRHQGR